MRSVLGKVSSDAQVTKENSAIVVNEKISSFNVAVNETVNVEIADKAILLKVAEF